MSTSMQLPTGLISDVTFSLLAEDVESSSGLALDIGSTTGKFVYRSNKEYKHGKPLQLKDDATNGTLHYAMFPRRDIFSLIKYVKDNADLTRNREGVVFVHSSGIGAAAFRQEIEEALNCKLDNTNEFDCFCNAFLSMKKSFTDDELCVAESPDEKARNQERKKKFEPISAGIFESSPMKFETFNERNNMKDEDRPKVLVMAGSGTGLMQINKDGTLTMQDVIFTAGHFMYGLGALLTGEKDFNKIVELAKKGDGRTSDTWTHDLLAAGGNHGDTPYDAAFKATDMNVFPLGKGIYTNLEDMRKEDLAYSSLNAGALIHCTVVNACAKACKAKHIYFAGNVFNTELMRTLMREKVHEVTMLEQSELDYEFHFLKNGGMFGALGAFLSKNKTE